MLCIQVMEPVTEGNHDWGNPLDATKTWPEDHFPLLPFGRMVLNETMEKHFLQSECIASSPGNVIPGSTFSNDKVLPAAARSVVGWVHSYADTQRYRLGANYLQMPVNAPRCPFMNR